MIRALHRAGPDDEHVLYLAIGGLTNLAVARGTACTFTRASGGGIEALAIELAERKALTLEHAHGWLAHVGLQAPGRGRSTGDEAIVEQARQVLHDGVRRIAAEVRNSLDFHRMQDDAAACHARRHDRPRQPRSPASTTRWPPSSACPSSRASVDGAPAGLDAGRVTVAAGLARRGGPGMKAVNLIPVEERRGCAAAAAPASPPTSSSACSPLVVAMSAAYTLDQPHRSATIAPSWRRSQARATAAEAPGPGARRLHQLLGAAPEAHRDRPRPRRQPLRLEPRAARGRAHDPGRRLADLAARAPSRPASQRRRRRHRSAARVAPRARRSSYRLHRRARPTSPQVISSLRRIDGVEHVSLSSSQKIDRPRRRRRGGGSEAATAATAARTTRSSR